MATGAALLGSALLGAVSYQNTELINDNGVPMAKVVVGSNAQISDGVAAANIAAVLGNMAFKQVAVSATVDGVAGLSCDVSGEGAGTCSVLSKSVDLEVVTPAGTVPAGAYGFETLIGDYVDAKLENRGYVTTSDEESETPWGDDIAAKKITGKDFNVIIDDDVNDPQSGFSVVEKQNIYVQSGLVHYDEADSEFIAEYVKLAYEIEFEGYGIPACTESKSGSWYYCDDDVGTDDDSNKAIENHRMKIMFLGEEWILSEMKPANNGAAPATNEEINGGSIKLAKESAYSPKLQIGESLDLGDGYKLLLGDLKPASGGQDSDFAIFSILNAAEEEVANQVISQEDGAVEITAGSNTYRVRVYQVAPGYTLTEKWAEVAVFANELELEDGETLSENDDWDVNIIWKDRDNNDANTTADNYVDHLYKIQIVGNDYSDLLVGDSLSIVDNPAEFRLTFTGLNTDSSNYLDVDFSIGKSGSVGYDASPGDSDLSDYRFYTGDNSTSTRDSEIKIKADEKIFTVYSASGSRYEVDELIYAPLGGNNYTARTVTYDPINGDAGDAVLLFKYDNKYFLAYSGTTAATDLYEGDMTVPYKLGSDDFDMVITMGNVTNHSGDDLTGEEVWATNSAINFKFEEDVENSETATFAVRAVMKDSGDNGELIFDAYGTNSADEDDEVFYNSSQGTAGTVELPYYTERGSELDGSKTSFTASLRREVGMLEGAMLHPNLEEGDEITLSGGTKVRVKNINVETSACEVEGGDATVTGLEGLSCVINANVANLGERQDIPTDLVVMDNVATDVETVIAVGGPMVNDVTAALLATESPLASAGDVYVEEVGAGKIVVAGYTADDTMTAAMNFIATLKGQ